MSAVGPLPPPGRYYSQTDESAFRQKIERVLVSLDRAMPRFAGDMDEGAVLTVVGGVPTWVVPTP